MRLCDERRICGQSFPGVFPMGPALSSVLREQRQLDFCHGISFSFGEISPRPRNLFDLLKFLMYDKDSGDRKTRSRVSLIKALSSLMPHLSGMALAVYRFAPFETLFVLTVWFFNASMLVKIRFQAIDVSRSLSIIVTDFVCKYRGSEANIGAVEATLQLCGFCGRSRYFVMSWFLCQMPRF